MVYRTQKQVAISSLFCYTLSRGKHIFYMHNLIVLCGPVGSGKSTTINKITNLHSHIAAADVFKYIQKYKDAEGHIAHENTLKAYRELYQDLEKINKDVILEIGVNNEEFNLHSINNLKQKFKIKIIFCLLDKEICIQRVMERGKQDKTRIIHPEDLEAKFRKPFPDNHLKLAKDLQIPFTHLDMSKPPEEILEFISTQFS